MQVKALAQFALMAVAGILQPENARLWYAAVASTVLHLKKDPGSAAAVVAAYTLATLWYGPTTTYADGVALALVLVAANVTSGSALPPQTGVLVSLTAVAAAVAATPSVRLLLAICVLMVVVVGCACQDPRHFDDAVVTAAALVLVTTSRVGVGADGIVTVLSLVVLGVALVPPPQQVRTI